MLICLYGIKVWDIYLKLSLNIYPFTAIRIKTLLFMTFASLLNKPYYLFPTSITISFEIFDFIHIDIWRPYKHKSITGERYFLTIVDDHSISTWVFLMREKNQTPYILKKYLAMVKNQFGRLVKTIRSDNRYDFLSSHSQALFDKLGIIH